MCCDRQDCCEPPASVPSDPCRPAARRRQPPARRRRPTMAGSSTASPTSASVATRWRPRSSPACNPEIARVPSCCCWPTRTNGGRAPNRTRQRFSSSSARGIAPGSAMPWRPSRSVVSATISPTAGATPTFLAGLALIEAHWRPTRTAFELACGIGHYGRDLARRGIAVTGADVVFAKLWLARHWVVPAETRLICFDAAAPWPVAEERFDLVFCHDAFYFLEPKAEILAAFEGARRSRRTRRGRPRAQQRVRQPLVRSCRLGPGHRAALPRRHRLRRRRTHAGVGRAPLAAFRAARRARRGRGLLDRGREPWACRPRICRAA